jgi:hypothetical protein
MLMLRKWEEDKEEIVVIKDDFDIPAYWVDEIRPTTDKVTQRQAILDIILIVI